MHRLSFFKVVTQWRNTHSHCQVPPKPLEDDDGYFYLVDCESSAPAPACLADHFNTPLHDNAHLNTSQTLANHHRALYNASFCVNNSADSYAR